MGAKAAALGPCLTSIPRQMSRDRWLSHLWYQLYFTVSFQDSNAAVLESEKLEVEHETEIDSCSSHTSTKHPPLPSFVFGVLSVSLDSDRVCFGMCWGLFVFCLVCQDGESYVLLL